MKKHWFNLALIALFILAVARPGLGGPEGPLYPEVLRVAAILLIFFLTGLTLRTTEMRTGFMNVRLHLFCQGFSFLFMPAVALLLRAWAPAWIPPEVLLGVVALSILPTTITSCVIFTTLAGGNVSGAVFNSVAGNMAGVFLSPLLFSILIAPSAGVQVDWGQLTEILKLIIAPLLTGIAVRPLVRPVLVRAAPFVSYASGAALLTIVFFAFSSAFSETSPLRQWSWPQLATPVALLLMLHVFFLAAAWYLGKAAGLQERERRTALFVAPQKTVALGLPLLHFFFADKPELAGLLSIPLIFYHPMQLLIAGPLATRVAARPQADG